MTVTTAGGVSATSSHDKFTYVAAPTVMKISPASGSLAGGTKVTITGTNLRCHGSRLWCGAVTSFISDTATQIVLDSPPATVQRVT